MFFQIGNAGGQQAHEKMLNITNHQGSANQNHKEISLQDITCRQAASTCQNGYYQKDDKNHVLAKMWRKGNSGALLVGL